jgi:acyl-CoA thioesterase I
MEKSVTRYDTYSTRNMLHPIRVLIISATLAVAACSSSEPARARGSTSAPAANAQAPAVASTRPRIVFLGDSLTAGLGLEAEQAVPSLVQRHLDAEGYKYEVVNAGVSGDTSAGGLRRLDWSLDGDVRILVLELGANDGLRGLPVSQMKENLKTIVQTAKKRGIDVLLTGMEAPPNYGAAYTFEFRRAFRDLAAEEGVAFMPFYLYEVAGIPTLNIADGIHPNPAGARIVETNLWRSLKPLVERQAR